MTVSRSGKNRLLIPALCLAVLLQAGILAMVYINAQIPLWTGKPVLLKTLPVDPRSLFRGNYARLTYDISQIPVADLNRHAAVIRPDQQVYVLLAPGPDQVYTYRGIHLEKPRDGDFIRGRLDNYREKTSGSYRVRFGIEAYFAPKEKALAIEKQLQSSAVARVYISGSGKAALEAIHAHETP
ncbi:MAG: GDYXXLXY domain-containing protein [Desulfobacter sp.]